MKVRLAYGVTGLEVELPQNGQVTVVEPVFVPGLPYPEQAVAQALKDPYRSASLGDRAGKNTRVAILFSDILIPVEAMGVGIEFNPGPQIPSPVRSRADVERLRVPEPEAAVPFVLEAVRELRRALPAHIPLLGFCGAPWTLANYVVEGGGAKEFVGLKRLCFEDPATAELLLEELAAANAAYLRAQIAAGAQAAGELFAYTHAGLCLGEHQRLGISVDGHEIDALQALIDHAVDSVASTAAHAHDFDAGEGFDLVRYWIGMG